MRIPVDCCQSNKEFLVMMEWSGVRNGMPFFTKVIPANWVNLPEYDLLRDILTCRFSISFKYLFLNLFEKRIRSSPKIRYGLWP